MLRRQLTRKQLLPFLARLEPCLVGMEACGGCTLLGPGDRQTRSHRAADEPALRQAIAQEPEERRQRCRGHLQGGLRLSMRFVPVKSGPQQDVQALHRIRFQQLSGVRR